MEYINFHCHNAATGSGISVVSFDAEIFDEKDDLKYKTVGVHPWSSSKRDVNDQLAKLHYYCNSRQVIGVGEIGLDRLNGGPLELQQLVFQKQIEIASELSKPIVIHCVRAWSELINIVSNKKYMGVKKAIHGFRRQPELARQLVERDFYFSFGSLIVDSTPELSEALTAVPLSRIFFETDESVMPIAEVYGAASDILNIPLDQLVNQVEANFKDFFGVDFL